MNLAELNKVAEAMVAPRQGHPRRRRIRRAPSRSASTRSASSNTEDNRRDYREMLFRSSEAMSKYISGVILYDETIRQKAKDGTPLVKLIEQAGALPGIKVDKGTKPLPFCPGEVITEGSTGCASGWSNIASSAPSFAKWRAVIDIGAGIPSYTCIKAQRACARALCRALPGGADRADRRAGSADGRRPRHRPLLRGHRMGAQGDVRGALLQPRRARRHGAQAEHGDPRQEVRASKASVEEVAEKTVRLLKACVPAAVPGIAFLSGGQSDEEATAHLDAMNKLGPPALEAHLLLRPRPAGRRRRRPGPARPRTSPPRSAPSRTAPG